MQAHPVQGRAALAHHDADTRRLLPCPLLLQAVKAASQDPLFRQAQDFYADKLYFQPSQRMAESLGLRQGSVVVAGVLCCVLCYAGSAAQLDGGTLLYCCLLPAPLLNTKPPPTLPLLPPRRLPLAKAQLYDAYVQHGVSSPRQSVYNMSGEKGGGGGTSPALGCVPLPALPLPALPLPALPRPAPACPGLPRPALPPACPSPPVAWLAASLPACSSSFASLLCVAAHSQVAPAPLPQPCRECCSQRHGCVGH